MFDELQPVRKSNKNAIKVGN